MGRWSRGKRREGRRMRWRVASRAGLVASESREVGIGFRVPVAMVGATVGATVGTAVGAIVGA